jgi:hypothetical protein
MNVFMYRRLLIRSAAAVGLLPEIALHSKFRASFTAFGSFGMRARSFFASALMRGALASSERDVFVTRIPRTLQPGAPRASRILAALSLAQRSS